MTQQIEDTRWMENAFAKRLLELKFNISTGHEYCLAVKPDTEYVELKFSRERIAAAKDILLALAFAR